MAVTTGGMGRGKLIPTNTTLCPHDVMDGMAKANGKDAKKAV